MADIAGIFAVSHTPVMSNMPDAPGAELRDAAFAQFTRVGEEIGALRPDAVVLISNDHLHNFFLDNFPAYCIGIAPSYKARSRAGSRCRSRRCPATQRYRRTFLAK